MLDLEEMLRIELKCPHLLTTSQMVSVIAEIAILSILVGSVGEILERVDWDLALAFDCLILKHICITCIPAPVLASLGESFVLRVIHAVDLLIIVVLLVVVVIVIQVVLLLFLRLGRSGIFRISLRVSLGICLRISIRTRSRARLRWGRCWRWTRHRRG